MINLIMVPVKKIHYYVGKIALLPTEPMFINLLKSLKVNLLGIGMMKMNGKMIVRENTAIMKFMNAGKTVLIFIAQI